MLRNFMIVSVGALSALMILAIIWVAMIAQSGTGAHLQHPMVFDVQQSVPVDLVFPFVLKDGTEITVTAPATVSISVQFQVEGAHVAATTVAIPEPSVTTITKVAFPTSTPQENDSSVRQPVELLPDLVNTDDTIAIFAAINRACNFDMTTAQREAALDEVRPSFANREVQLTGFVQDVRSNLSGGYDVVVALEKISEEVTVKAVPKEAALLLKKGDYVLLTGQLTLPACGFYVQVEGTVTAVD